MTHYQQAQDEIEERAREEFERNDPKVGGWLAIKDLDDLTPVLTLAYRARRNPEYLGSFGLALSNLVDDYVACRVDDCEDEIAALARRMRELDEQHCDERV